MLDGQGGLHYRLDSQVFDYCYHFRDDLFLSEQNYRVVFSSFQRHSTLVIVLLHPPVLRYTFILP